MDEGRSRGSWPHVWPPSVTRPEAKLLVYLDLNHWIGLAKAATGHRAGRSHQHALGALRRLSSEGGHVFPLSAKHYFEMAAIQDPRQRRDVGEVMADISGFAALTPLDIVMQIELEAALDELTGETNPQTLPLSLLRFGSAGAFGKVGGLSVRSDGVDVTPQVRAEWPEGRSAFDEMLSGLNQEFEFRVLIGPTDEDVPALRAAGWNPSSAHEMNENRARSEAELQARLDAEPRWRRGRLRDVIGARHVAIELLDFLNSALARRRLDFDLLDDRRLIRRLVDCMPTADARVSLMVEAHRNPQTRWSPNQIVDLDALSLAVPYCDVVACDAQMAHLVKASGTNRRLGATVFDNLDNLVLHLTDEP